ncbi:uncharacterized protein ARMOST_17092 [Armillaria ostoyae]|uniref:Uncharacterized protein n=1 Tax=Armillaria ostoyae TaxID=47428 RepID=A0A284RY25_ARMOS|nr:uncharacterized protein ARMOST_17092 [Armillaria ostoyae]
MTGHRCMCLLTTSPPVKQDLPASMTRTKIATPKLPIGRAPRRQVEIKTAQKNAASAITSTRKSAAEELQRKSGENEVGSSRAPEERRT